MLDSIFCNNECCFVCGTTLNLEVHHIYGGNPYRKYSTEDKCIVYLCHNDHTGTKGVHKNKYLDNYLKTECQLKWMKKYHKDKDSFRRRYGHNYLD